jgi:glycosyltransferase involved in cell wall biosynthesis
MPFAYEGFGIAILEAMAFGLPAFCSREGAATETVEHGVNGYLFSTADSTEIGSLILQLHENRDLLQNLSLAAYRTASTRPGWQQTAAMIETFLLKLVSGHPPHQEEKL